jgi:3-hydroxyisobutyrate dehydrogenase-like beta-hydroxyacid dehydrogenase
MKIGFIGIGYMGHGMAKNILEKGYSLKFIANVKRKAADNLISRGAIEETRIQDLCRDIDVLQLCLSSSDQVEDILINKRAINFLKKDSVIIDSTTANPVSSENIIKICTENNINFIDAPLGKTPKEAWDGSLDAIVGAKNDVLEKFKPIINCWAGRIVHVGDPGSGHKLKLLNNMLSLSYYSLYYEVLTICKQSKISEETFHSVISGSRMDNELFQSFMKYVLDPRKENQHKFSVDNANKDLGYLMSLAMQNNAPTLMGSAAKQVFEKAKFNGFADKNVSELYHLLVNKKHNEII